MKKNNKIYIGDRVDYITVDGSVYSGLLCCDVQWSIIRKVVEYKISEGDYLFYTCDGYWSSYLLEQEIKTVIVNGRVIYEKKT